MSSAAVTSPKVGERVPFLGYDLRGEANSFNITGGTCEHNAGLLYYLKNTYFPNKFLVCACSMLSSFLGSGDKL